MAQAIEDVQAPETQATTSSDAVTSLPIKKRRSVSIKAIIAAAVAFFVGVGVGVSGSAGSEDQLRETRAEIRALEGRNNDLITENSDLTDEVSVLGEQISSMEAELADAKSAAAKAERQAAGNAKGISVNYGEWDGLFSITGATLIYDYGWEVVGQMEYLGGGDCPLGYVEVNATYFQGNKIIGTDFTNYTNMSEGSKLPLEIYGPNSKPSAVELVVSDASCA